MILPSMILSARWGQCDAPRSRDSGFIRVHLRCPQLNISDFVPTKPRQIFFWRFSFLSLREYDTCLPAAADRFTADQIFKKYLWYKDGHR